MCAYIYIYIYVVKYISRTKIVSCKAKQSRKCDTTVCYMNKRLIECSSKAYCKTAL